MTMADILVEELRPEHRGREWVDRYGWHWSWCENQWLVSVLRMRIPWTPAVQMTYFHNYGWCDEPGDGYSEHPERDNGPFMEALHHRVIYEGRR